jgi:hypothetical protein
MSSSIDEIIEVLDTIKLAPPVIVCAAIRSRVTGRIVCGARHYDSAMRQFMIRRRFWLFGRFTKRKEWRSSEQGFIDQFCKFYNRSEAADLVKKSGQPLCVSQLGATLYSEDLY